jgi:hypothetical protein
MSIVLVGSTSGSVTLQEPAVAGTTILTLPATSGTILQSGTAVTETQGGTGTTTGYYGFKNRLINGAMVIDQRNAGASGTANGYTVDRMQFNSSLTTKGTWQQNAGSVTPPIGFTNYLGFTSNSAYTVPAGELFSFQQRIEGYNVADLGFGTANAKTITLSFWVRSSLTGTFGGSLRNGAADRSYPFTYTISAANTWEYETITIAGDTAGTWLTTNGIGLTVIFGLGVGSTFSGTAGSWQAGNLISATGATSVVGTNGATWYVTGVQLEVGSTATSFDYRPYGTELALCQRYYFKVLPAAGSIPMAVTTNSTTTSSRAFFVLPVTMRVAPTALEQTGTASDYRINAANANTTLSSVPTLGTALPNLVRIDSTVASGLTAGQAGSLESNSSAGFIALTAEL